MEEMDNESVQEVRSRCLRDHVILQELFGCFSPTELIQLSLVNKQWKEEARRSMRNRGILSANLNKNQTCQDLRAFASVLRRMRDVGNVVPFSGMTIYVGGTKCSSKDYCQQSPNSELEPVYEEILSALNWKHLSIKHLPGWNEHKSCPGYILGQKIFQRFYSVLEELSVQLEPNEAISFKDEFLQGFRLSSLKTFKLLNDEDSCETEWSDLIKTVVSNAPNLQILYTKECVDLEDDLLEGSSAVHVADAGYSSSTDEIPESAAGQIKIDKLILLKFSSDFSLGRFNSITSKLLQSSRFVMGAMSIDVNFLAPLIKYGVCLECVKEFDLALVPPDLQEIQPHVWRVAKSFDFTRMFPNLKEINILAKTQCSVPEEFNVMIEQVSAALGTPAPDRAANIKHLQLDLYRPNTTVTLGPSSLRLLAQMFPDVEKLTILAEKLPVTDFPGIWARLREVVVEFYWVEGNLVTNLDSVFCGIFPVEVALLREQDEEYLRKVNIVPVMPCIAYWKELTTFDVHYEKRLAPYTGPTDDPSCLFSKVAGLIAFKRRPNLTVILKSEDERLAAALGHLRPYAEVKFDP